MKTIMRTYLNPIIVAILMLIIMGLWAWQRWQSELKYYDERIYRHAGGVFDAVQGTIQALEQANSLEWAQIEGILENVVRLSRLHFVALEQDGKRVLEVGSVPATLQLTSEEGKSLIGRELLLWRKVHLQDETEGDLNRNSHISGPRTGGDVQVMILGFEIPRESRMLSAAKKSIALTLSTVLLFLTTGLIVWIMVIRSRLLAGQLETERARRDHLEELGLAAAGLAHETKNPLGIILGLAQQISANPKEPEQSRVMLEHIIDEVDKAQARLGNFMTFARQRKVNATSLDVRAVAAKVAEILQPDFGALGVSLEINCPPLAILADEEMLQQLLVNLLLNSLHASSPGDRVTVQMARKGKTAVLTVADEGSGVSPELLPNIFRPYVSGNAGGHGLGLAIVKRFVEEHGWTIAVDSRPGRGMAVAIPGMALSEAKEPKG
ncbi:MAG: ATP-binding protein [Deltaproteobacteria bacterium]|nr:ATP-binding protein [Deltaproteobacteria bacterium]